MGNNAGIHMQISGLGLHIGYRYPIHCANGDLPCTSSRSSNPVHDALCFSLCAFRLQSMHKLIGELVPIDIQDAASDKGDAVAFSGDG
jgi:hypothetical protein